MDRAWDGAWHIPSAHGVSQGNVFTIIMMGEELTGPQVVAEAEAGGEDTPVGGRMLVWGRMAVDGGGREGGAWFA